MASFWDKEKIAGEVLKTDTSKYIISVCQRKNRTYLNIREWYLDTADNQWKPAKAGAAIPYDDEVADEVVKLMQAALDMEIE